MRECKREGGGGAARCLLMTVVKFRFSVTTNCTKHAFLFRMRSTCLALGSISKRSVVFNAAPPRLICQVANRKLQQSNCSNYCH